MSWMILKGGPGLSFPYSNVALSHVPHQFAPFCAREQSISTLPPTSIFRHGIQIHH